MASLAIPSSSSCGTTAPVGLLGLPIKIGFVGHVARIQGDNFITRVDNSTHRQIDTFADTDRYQDLSSRVVIQSIAALQQGGNFFAQFGYAIVRCIAGMP